MDFPAPAIVSTTAILQAPTQVYACRTCGHVQKPNLPEVEQFYDQEYKISLDSEDHDQLYEVVDGKPIYRTPFQSKLATSALGIEPGMAVLDYGCGKAATLAQIATDVPGIVPAVFDVSDSYQEHWNKWISKDNQAKYEVPNAWSGRFDRVMAHFVLEHVIDPVSVFSEIARVLKSDGKAFVTVPNALTNFGDLLVIDHINHFSHASLRFAASKAGMTLESLSEADYRGAYVAVLSKSESVFEHDEEPDISVVKDIATRWNETRERIVAHAAANPGETVEIYGAGFYGAFIAMLVQDSQRIVRFVDRNLHLKGSEVFGIPVRHPDDVIDQAEANLPATLYAGLNPAHAESIMKSWCEISGRDPRSVVYL